MKSGNSDSKKHVRVLTIERPRSFGSYGGSGRSKNYGSSNNNYSSFEIEHKNEGNRSYKKSKNNGSLLEDDYDNNNDDNHYDESSSKSVWIEKLNNLTPEEIKDRLKNFTQIPTDKVDSIPTQTKIQYLYKFNNVYRYRPGGTLQYNGAPEYIVLTNGDKKWSIQLKNAVIFREKDFDEMKQEYENKLDKYRLCVKKQKQIINDLKKKLQLFSGHSNKKR